MITIYFQNSNQQLAHICFYVQEPKLAPLQLQFLATLISGFESSTNIVIRNCKSIGNQVIRKIYIQKKYRELHYKEFQKYREQVIGNFFPITKFPILFEFLILFAIPDEKKPYDIFITSIMYNDERCLYIVHTKIWQFLIVLVVSNPLQKYLE